LARAFDVLAGNLDVNHVDSLKSPNSDGNWTYRLICGVVIAVLTLAGCGSDVTNQLACPPTPQAAPAPRILGPSPGVTTAIATSAVHKRRKTIRDQGFDVSVDNARAVYGAGMPFPVPDGPAPAAESSTSIFLPSTLYLLAGQRYRLEFAKIISGFNSSTEEVIIGSPEEGSVIHPDYWEYTPSAPGSFTLSITVKDNSGTIRASTSRPAVVSAVRTGSDLRLLSIGDSITRAGGYADLAVQCILGGKTVGTRTYDNGSVSTEGRGGWTMERYLTRIAEPTGGDSPFLFPVGVKGSKYRGNTCFWRDVTAANPDGYDYDGFQMIARGWRTTGSYPFDPNGYPTSADVGDVVVDPSLPAGAQWRQYDGSTWSTMNPQPNVGVSFAKYVERYAAAFSSGPPTSISIMLGTVDFLSSPPELSWSTYKSRLDWLLASIRQWDPDVPIILIGPPSGAPANMWADQRIKGPEFNRRIVDLSRRLYATYDTPEGRADGIYVISFLGVVASDNMADYVHPKSPEGHDQMGPWLAGILAHLVSEGLT
jgi:hypothetical protein